MQIIIRPEKTQWRSLLQRPYMDNSAVLNSVQNILEEVKKEGDEALRKLTTQFDGITLQQLDVSEAEIKDACEKVPQTLKAAIQQAKKNIETFHQAQLTPVAVIETVRNLQFLPASFIYRIGCEVATVNDCRSEIDGKAGTEARDCQSIGCRDDPPVPAGPVRLFPIG